MSNSIDLQDSNPRHVYQKIMKKKLRVGIIVADADQPFLIYDLYLRSLKSENYTIECLIVHKKSSKESEPFLGRIKNYIKQRGVKRFFGRIAFAVVDKIEGFVASKNAKFKEVFAKHCLSKFQISKVYVSPLISSSGLVYRYSDEDIQLIKNANLDVLIRGGGGILRGDILEVCRFGVLSFHHADNNINRGGPPGFWEVFYREPSTGFVIQRLLSELDGGDVIFKGSIATSFLYKFNLCRLYIKSSVFLHQTLEKLGTHQAPLKVLPKVPYAYPLYTSPTIAQVIQYLFRTFFVVSSKLIRKLTRKSFRWGVAYQFAKDWKTAVLWKSIVIKNPPSRFLADPFVVTLNGRTVMFVEDYDYRASRGKISAWELKSNGHRELGTALEEDFHLSYPFLIRTEKELFMVPDTHKKNTICLYRCIDFPLKWELAYVLLEGFSAADSSVFEFNNKWWIFTNKDSSDLGDHGSELHIFYSDSLESGNWRPHPENPVIFDSTIARNGGLILDSDGIYRVYQKQGFDMYGESMGVSKITELNVNSYKEEKLFEVPPRFMKNIKGTHTLSFESGVLCLDFVKIEGYDK